jgi:LAO/AO transport system kinase
LANGEWQMADGRWHISRRELARLISGIENGDPSARARLHQLYPHSGRAHIVGITGAPGCGKSTLVAALAGAVRRSGRTAAIISIDPTSPFTGGAILGDRIRMRELSGDEGVFIRSMANRGARGGLASATADVAVVLDAAGFDMIFVETVGAGQADVDVAQIAQTVIVVEAPGLGDDVQAIKAGILEIADILVVNKADRDGVAQLVAALRAALDLAPMNTGHHGVGNDRRRTMDDDRSSVVRRPSSVVSVWQIPIVKTIATRGEGADELLAEILRHRRFLDQDPSGQRRNRQRAEQDMLARLRDLLLQNALRRIHPDRYRTLIEACAQREMHPDDAAGLIAEASDVTDKL